MSNTCEVLAKHLGYGRVSPDGRDESVLVLTEHECGQLLYELTGDLQRATEEPTAHTAEVKRVDGNADEPGYRAVCACGWESVRRFSADAAVDDYVRHSEAHS